MISVAALFALLPIVFAQVVDPGLVAKLRAAATNVDRISLLQDNQFIFNFLAGVGVTAGSGGKTTGANAGNYPALIGNGVAMTVGYLEGCGLNVPHVHPRATEINFAVNGTLRTGMLAENGARFVFNDVPAGSAAVFPQGAIHFEMNTECEPTLFVAAFNHEDPGALAVAQRFFGIPTDIVAATLDSLGIVEIATLESKIPNNVAQGTEDCLTRCGIPKANQPTTQRQPRGSGNPLPPGFSGPPPPPPPPPPPMPSNVSGAVNTDTAFRQNPTVIGAVSGGGSLPSMSSDVNVRPVLIALLAINAFFVLGSLAMLFLYVMKKRGVKHERVREFSSSQFSPLHDEKYYDPYHRPQTPVVTEKP